MAIEVSVFYASASQQQEVTIAVSADTTAIRAIKASGILAIFPEIDLQVMPIGIFGKKVPLDATLNAGDRIEIYRSLVMDPKTARLNRAQGASRRG
jgi:putative ubiquitin-RnfH superfamily antitoxin RatB of RatAB toxin-antitoxin module